LIDSVQTRPSLLLRIRNVRDSQAWTEFAEIYGPLIYAYGRRRHLQDADAADLTQEVLKVVSRTVVRFEYSADRGGFRRWLWTIARNELKDLVRRLRRGPSGAGNSEAMRLLSQTAKPDEDFDLWEANYQQTLLHWAAQRVQTDVQASTWQAFWRTSIEGRRPEAVAASLGISVGAVYIAKSRVVKRLRELIESLEDE